MSVRFVWDPKKEAKNRLKHEGITFEEASTVFRDALAYIFDDEEHSDEEVRELIIGYSNRNRLLIVSFTERGDDIRIFSARKADKGEQDDYQTVRR